MAIKRFLQELRLDTKIRPLKSLKCLCERKEATVCRRLEDTDCPSRCQALGLRDSPRISIVQENGKRL